MANTYILLEIFHFRSHRQLLHKELKTFIYSFKFRSTFQSPSVRPASYHHAFTAENGTFCSLWPWPLTYDTDFSTWPRSGPGESLRQTRKSEAIFFIVQRHRSTHLKY